MKNSNKGFTLIELMIVVAIIAIIAAIAIPNLAALSHESHTTVRRPKSQESTSEASRRNWVGGGVAPAVLPHHRTYGSVYGGSCCTLKLLQML